MIACYVVVGVALGICFGVALLVLTLRLMFADLMWVCGGAFCCLVSLTGCFVVDCWFSLFAHSYLLVVDSIVVVVVGLLVVVLIY